MNSTTADTGSSVGQLDNVGVVVIGRNEGERLLRCLKSVIKFPVQVVYVDSNSNDGSIEVAQSLGVNIIHLTDDIPLTAARARNAGFDKLKQWQPNLEFVQFIDGDCELDPKWLVTAKSFLNKEPCYGIVCGRRREKYLEHSIYNRMCDLEWDTPVGETVACGGDFMVRTTAFTEVGGFNSTLIAGEEPELCLRLRAAGWKIRRINAEMTLHDAAILKFSQWWRRAARSGHAYFESVILHGFTAQRSVRMVISIIFWGFIFPLAIFVLVIPTHGFSLLFLILYIIQWLRISALSRKNENATGENYIYASFILLGKFAQLIGIFQYIKSHLTAKPKKLIEYK